jgi:hypothetical protein
MNNLSLLSDHAPAVPKLYKQGSTLVGLKMYQLTCSGMQQSRIICQSFGKTPKILICI